MGSGMDSSGWPLLANNWSLSSSSVNGTLAFGSKGSLRRLFPKCGSGPVPSAKGTSACGSKGSLRRLLPKSDPGSMPAANGGSSFGSKCPLRRRFRSGGAGSWSSCSLMAAPLILSWPRAMQGETAKASAVATDYAQATIRTEHAGEAIDGKGEIGNNWQDRSSQG